MSFTGFGVVGLLILSVPVALVVLVVVLLIRNAEKP
jgi:hypothetical protein